MSGKQNIVAGALCHIETIICPSTINYEKNSNRTAKIPHFNTYLQLQENTNLQKITKAPMSNCTVETSPSQIRPYTPEQHRHDVTKINTHQRSIASIRKSAFQHYANNENSHCSIFQRNRIVERWHRTLKTALRTKLSNSWSWLNELPIILLGLRANLRTDAGVTPAELTTSTGWFL